MPKYAGVLLVAVVLLAGCTTTAQQPPGIDSLFSDSEDFEIVARCLTERGWDPEVRDGAILVDVPAEQKDAYERDSLECWTEAGVDTDGTLTEDDYEAIYEWYGEIAACLEGAGFPTPTTPSFEVFRSTYESDPWIPWADVPAPDLGRASEVCPVMNVPIT